MIFKGTTTGARTRLERMIASESDPALSPEEIDDLLFDSRRADVSGGFDTYRDWSANSGYAVGDLVAPTVRNGHYYRVSASDGSSGGTEPTWPTTSGESVTADGVTYVEQGTTSYSLSFDLDWAAAEGWEIKAARASSKNQTVSDGRGQAASYLYLNCVRNAEKYRKRIQASIPLIGRRDWLNA